MDLGVLIVEVLDHSDPPTHFASVTFIIMLVIIRCRIFCPLFCYPKI